MDLPILDISHEWNYTVCGLLMSTAFLHYHYIFRTHPCSSMYQHLIPFYCQIIFHCIDISHFVYSFIHWMNNVVFLGNRILFSNLGYFHFWLFWIMLLWILCPGFCLNICFHSLGSVRRSRIVESYDKSVFSILRNYQTWGSYVFAKVAGPFDIPTSNEWGFEYFHILTNTCYCLSF